MSILNHNQRVPQLSPHPTGRNLTLGDSVVLLLDTDGRIQVASVAAHSLWQASSTELTNDFFPNLFTFDVVSRDSGWVQSQWEVLLAIAQEQPVALKLQPKESAAIDALVRIEKAGDEPARYFAFVSLPAPPVSPPVASASPFATPATTDDNFLIQLYEWSPLGFFELNLQKNEVYYSPAWKRMLGYADTALPNTYDSWLALIHPDDSTAAPDRQGRGGAIGTRQFSIEFRMKHAKGHYVWVQSVGLQLYAPNGVLQRVIGAHLDIADRKEFEETSLRAEERLLQLTERGRAGAFDLNFSDGHCWLSPGFKSLLGYEESDQPDTFDVFARVLPKDETAGGTQAYFLAKHPNQVFYFDTLRLCHREGHEVLVHAGIVRQISRRKGLQRVLGFTVPPPNEQATVAGESNLLMPAAHLAALLAEIHEAVLIADASSQIIYLNARAEQLLMRTTEECRHQRASEIFRLVHRTSGQPGENPIDKSLITGDVTPLNTEFALDVGGAHPIPIAFSARVLRDTAGKANGAVVVFRNPEEMRLTPEELVRANRFEVLGQLAGGIAHDFNNLLTTILGGISLAKDTLNSSGLANSERACLAAKGLSKQLLTYSKGGPSVRQVVKPAEILADAIRLAAAGSAVKFELNVAPETFTVCVDRAQILQVFQNLIINAIQAMPAGQGNIWITAGNVAQKDTELLATLPAGNYVSIEVRDDGSGIEPEHLGKIFAPFFTTKKNGTGLGLATVLSIVKQHSGQMGIASKVGIGTAFTVCLPQADKPAETEAKRAPSIGYGTGRILFMDDDENISLLTGGMLDSLGYKFDLARNGEEAVKLYKRYLTLSRPYDAVIMDLTIIGGMGGEETFKILRQLDPDVRAIIASGYDVDEMAAQYLKLGFCGYLTKPYRVGDLGKIIRTVLGK